MASKKKFRSFESFWKPYIRIFQVFCVSHYSIYRQPNQGINRLFYHITFLTMHCIAMIYTVKTLYNLRVDRFKEMALMRIVSYISSGGYFLEHAVAHLEPLFTRKHEEEIYKRFEEINTIFTKKLKYNVDFDALRKKQKYTIGFYVLSAIQAFGLSFFTYPMNNFYMLFYLLFRAIATINIRVRRFQTSVIINLLSNILGDVQTLLKRRQENNIIHLRLIYSKVLLIQKSISCCFGFSFLTFLMNYCFDVIYSSYWAYITINLYGENSRMFNVIRKFHHIYHTYALKKNTIYSQMLFTTLP